MGFYLNSREPQIRYQKTIENPYFVDKSAILTELIPLLGTSSEYVCITRPRRFGKTVIASMIASFFSKGCETKNMFQAVNKLSEQQLERHLNNHNLIYIDFSEVDDECNSYDGYISNIKNLLREDLKTAYPQITFREQGTVSEDLRRISNETGEQFIFVMDEWDAIFHMPFIDAKDHGRFLLFLKGLLKDKSYVELAYMTGILPIAKYSSGSELNMFFEYSMVSQAKYSEYFGFTDAEVDELYQKYIVVNEQTEVTREGLRLWYDGYHTLSGERIYNPRSVVAALSNNQMGSYWTSAGPYDEIFYYIEKNIADVRDELALMIAGEAVNAKVQEYAVTSMDLSTKNEIFSAMVVYGFLTYENGKISIPNKELMDKFADMLQKESSLGYIYRLAKESERMLAATLAGDTKTMAEILSYAHDTETPLLSYNKETELSAIVNLVYLAARDYYDVQREDKAGIGYVDFIFYPKKNKNDDCIILELKVNHTPEDAIKQIKERKYAMRFMGKIGENPIYTGRILAVGIGYDTMTKEHFCRVEELKR